MKKIRVLIADDSMVYRSQIKMALGHHPHIEIVAAVANGLYALEVLKYGAIDLFILDLEMPEMDGLSTLKEMNVRDIHCKTLVFSSFSTLGAECTLNALKLGACDFITKPGALEKNNLAPSEKIKEVLLPKIDALFPVERAVVAETSLAVDFRPMGQIQWELFRPKIIVIGSSTGGPAALESIFTNIKYGVNCPIVITQHMPPLYTATLAQRLGKLTGMKSKEAESNEKLLVNTIYVAPGNYHLRLSGTAEESYFTLDQEALIHSVRPAVDPLFQSASQIFKEKCLGFILTGMGNDGCDGAISIKQNKGAVVIQEESSCVVFGMPGAVYRAGAYDVIANLGEITNIILDKASYFSK